MTPNIATDILVGFGFFVLALGFFVAATAATASHLAERIDGANEARKGQR